MKLNIAARPAALLLALALMPAAAWADPPESLVNGTQAQPQQAALHPSGAAHPFAAMAGTWQGGGTIDLTGEIHEKLRCRATYNYGQSNASLTLAIRCASDNYKFELTSNVVDRGGRISGQWSEATYNVTGSINGRVAGNKVTAVAQSDGLNADIAVTTTGNQQSVTITPKSTYVISVQIAMAKR
jgi:autotransporter translocation and assembly factor TamB